MSEPTKHLWEVKHSYYCEAGQYFGGENTIENYKSFADFLAAMGDCDPDYNLLFRWDWSERDDDLNETFNGDNYYRNGKLSLFFMAQRKGYHFTHLVEVCRADEPAVRAFLAPRLVHLLSLWEPLTPDPEASK